MTNKEAVNWLINITADIGKTEHRDLWHYEQALTEIKDMLESEQPEIVRCGECKWYGRANKQRFYRGMDCLQRRISTIVPDKDFCSRAERKCGEKHDD